MSKYQPCQVVVVAGASHRDPNEFFEVIEDQGHCVLARTWCQKLGGFIEQTATIPVANILRVAGRGDRLPVKPEKSKRKGAARA